MRHETNRIQRKDHNIGSYRVNKISFFPTMIKKYLLED